MSKLGKIFKGIILGKYFRIEINFGKREIIGQLGFKKIYLYLINVFFLVFLITSSNLRYIGLNYSNITLKVKGTGYNSILGNYTNSYSSYIFNSSFYPDEIYINGEKQNIILI